MRIKADKTCCQNGMDYGDIKDLPIRTASEEVVLDIAFNIAKNLEYGRYQCELATMVYKVFDEMFATHKRK